MRDVISRFRAVAFSCAAALSIGSGVAGCGSDDSGKAQAGATKAEADSISSRPSITGRWLVLRSCDGMLESAGEAGLRRLGPSLVGDYFPGQTPEQLAIKANVCSGAEPHEHSHFFTDDGQFGSLDQHGDQVDDGPYEVVDERTLRLGSGSEEETFRYRITRGDELTLEPVISTRAKREALRTPMEFSLAGHMAAVAYAGHTWRRVDCEGWC